MVTETAPHFRQLVAEAARIVGSQTQLARLMGRSQQQISTLCTKAERISAEDAVAIEAATAGQIQRWRLRPDLWSEPLEGKAA